MSKTNTANQNGNAPEQQTPTVTLTANLATGALQVDIKVPNLDVALNMLAQATRHLDAQFRAEKAQELQAAMVRRMEDARIAQQILGGRA